MESSSDLKHLVIVGASFAGLGVLTYVQSSYRITVIEKKDFFEWVCLTPRSMIDKEDWFDKEGTVLLKDTFENKKVFGDNVEYIQGLLTEVVDDKSLKFKRVEGIDFGSDLKSIPEETLNFDFLVLATGANFTINESSVDNVYNIFSRDRRREFFESYREKIEKAKSVLIVGGGATGCETAAELLIQYGDSKKIGLVHGTDRLLPSLPEAASEKAKANLEQNGVKVYLNTRYDERSSLSKEYDFTIKCMGTQVYTPYLDKSFKDCKDAKGRIYVNDHLQITNVNHQLHPSKRPTKGVKVYKNIFCHGDACLTSMNEWKTATAMLGTTGVLVANLAEMCKPSPNLKSIDLVTDNISSVYTAKDYGVVVTNDAVDENPGILGMKTYIYQTYMNYFKGNEGAQAAFFEFGSGFVATLNKYNTSCWYRKSPYSKRPAKERRKKELRAILKGEEP